MRPVNAFAVLALAAASIGPVAADPAVPQKQLLIPYVLSLSQPSVEVQASWGNHSAAVVHISKLLSASPYDPPIPKIGAGGFVKMRIARLAKPSIKHRIVCEAKGTSALEFLHQRTEGLVEKLVAQDKDFGVVDNQFAFDFFPSDKNDDEITIAAPAGIGPWEFGRCRITAGPAPASPPLAELRTPPVKALGVLQTKPYRFSVARPRVQVLAGTGAFRAGILGVTGGLLGYLEDPVSKDLLFVLHGFASDSAPSAIHLLVARVTPNKPHRLNCQFNGTSGGQLVIEHRRAKPGITAIKSIADTTVFQQFSAKFTGPGTVVTRDFFVGSSGQDLFSIAPSSDPGQAVNLAQFLGCDVSLAS